MLTRAPTERGPCGLRPDADYRACLVRGTGRAQRQRSRPGSIGRMGSDLHSDFLDVGRKNCASFTVQGMRSRKKGRLAQVS